MSTISKVPGLAEARLRLTELPRRVARNVLSRAAYAGGTVFRDEARLRAPVYTGPVSQGHPPPGTLKKQVYAKSIPERSSEFRRVVFVSVRHGKKQQRVGKKQINRDAYYWWFVEGGTKYMQARPYLRPAFEARKQDAAQAVKSSLLRGIEDERRKLVGK